MAVHQLDDGNDEGTVMGQTDSSKIGFFGLATPVSRRAAAAQATTALASSTDFASQHLAALQEVMNTLAAYGLWKGSA